MLDIDECNDSNDIENCTYFWHENPIVQCKIDTIRRGIDSYRNTQDAVIPNPFTIPMYLGSAELFSTTLTARKPITTVNLNEISDGTNAYQTNLWN